MNRDLEEYIDKNRSEFDQVESFDMEESWMNIQLNNTQQQSKSQTSESRLLWIIALFFIITLSLITWNVLQKSAIEQEIANLPSDMIDIHESLISRVNLNQKKLEAFDIKSSEFEEILEEIEAMEDQKAILQHDFNKTGDKEEYAKILLKHYERKARIIELLLYEINKQKNDDNIKKI